MDMTDKPIPPHSPGECAKLTGMSRAKLYEAWRRGGGPRFYYAEGKRRRITEEARQEWIKELEAETAAKLNGGHS
jgi:hypothetical protein